MTYRILCRRETWMSDAEWKRARAVRRMMLAPLIEANIPLLPYLHQHLQDYLVAHLLALRAERALVEIPNEDGSPLPPPPPALLESLGKQRDRARKLLLEIEAYNPKPESQRPKGIADLAQPLMERFKHLEEEYFPPDFAFRISTPDTPGAPFRIPEEDTPITSGPHTPFDYAIDTEPAKEEQSQIPTPEVPEKTPAPQTDTNPEPPQANDTTPTSLQPTTPTPQTPAPPPEAPQPHDPRTPSPNNTPLQAHPQRSLPPRTTPPPKYQPQRPPPHFVAIVT